MQKYTLMSYFPYGGRSSRSFKFQLLFGLGSTIISEKERGSPEARLWGRLESRIFFCFNFLEMVYLQSAYTPHRLCVSRLWSMVSGTQSILAPAPRASAKKRPGRGQR